MQQSYAEIIKSYWLALPYRWYVASGLAFVVLGGFIGYVYFVPSLRAHAVDLYGDTLKRVGLEPKEEVVLAAQDPVEAQKLLFEDRIKKIDGSLEVQRLVSADQQAQLAAVQEELKKTLADVSSLADETAKRQQEWLATLRKVSVATVTASATAKTSGTPSSSSQSAGNPSQAQPSAKAAASATASGLVNINSANVAELDGLPSIGASYAQRIIDYRNQHGAFTSIEGVKEVAGIGDSTFGKIKSLITV